MSKFILLKENKWWLLWAIITPLFYTLSITIPNIFLQSYISIIILFLPPAFFGLWAYSKDEFKKEYLKLVVIFLVLFLLIFSFGYMAGLLAVIFLLFIFKRIGFTKEQFSWSFGSMMLYLILGVIPILLLFVVDTIFQINYDFVKRNNIGNYIALLGAILQGFVFGKLMQYFYKKRVVK